MWLQQLFEMRIQKWEENTINGSVRAKYNSSNLRVRTYTEEKLLRTFVRMAYFFEQN